MGSVPEETEIIFGDSRNMTELKDESIHPKAGGCGFMKIFSIERKF